jgi:L-ascorbate metabolism protein UlaG (beta-lactamase superfamily)
MRLTHLGHACVLVESGGSRLLIDPGVYSSGWDHEPPAPELPAEVVEQTAARYREAYERITGDSWSSYLERMGVA